MEAVDDTLHGAAHAEKAVGKVAERTAVGIAGIRDTTRTRLERGGLAAGAADQQVRKRGHDKRADAQAAVYQGIADVFIFEAGSQRLLSMGPGNLVRPL